MVVGSSVHDETFFLDAPPRRLKIATRSAVVLFPNLRKAPRWIFGKLVINKFITHLHIDTRRDMSMSSGGWARRTNASCCPGPIWGLARWRPSAASPGRRPDWAAGQTKNCDAAPTRGSNSVQ